MHIKQNEIKFINNLEEARQQHIDENMLFKIDCKKCKNVKSMLKELSVFNK